MSSARKKILIIRLSSIGDILLTTPFIRQTRKRFPEAQIDFVVKEKFRQLISANPYIDTVYPLEQGRLLALIGKLYPQKYDYIFDLHGNMRSILIAACLRSKTKSRIKKSKIIQQLLVKFKINRYASVKQIPERYLAVGLDAGITDDEEGLEFFWDQTAEASANRSLENIASGRSGLLIAVAPGAGFYTKRWPTAYFIDLLEKIAARHETHFLILGNRQDSDLGAAIAQNRGRVTDFTGKLDLMETGAVLSNCDTAVTNDSGLMHLATAVKTPVLAIFGSSVREFGFYPYRGTSAVIENTDLKCRPCSHIGRNTCPRGHFKCMLELTPDIVADAFGEFLTGIKKK